MTCWNKIRAGWELKKLSKTDNVITLLNDIKDFCCLDLKRYVLFYIEFSSNMLEFICNRLHGPAK